MAPATPRARGASRWIAPHGVVGLALVGVAWAVSWSHLRPLSDEAFFPLWLGYIVTVDALVQPRLGRSLLQAGPIKVLRVFAVSAGVWWLFELFNVRTDNWHYLHPSPVGPIRFAIESTIDFSTVLPAIFETTALFHALLPGRQSRDPVDSPLPSWATTTSLLLGVLFLVLPLVRPRYFYPLIWVSMFFLVDPINARLGRPSLLASALGRRLRPVFVLALAGLTCGFFWEMWNILAMPKWVYSVPYVPQQRLFEMPLVGYSGYLPFALECFAIYTLVASAWQRGGGEDGPRFVPVS